MTNDEFQTIRLAAREKRNRAIAAAQGEYEATLRKITELELAIRDQVTKRSSKISVAIERVMPHDRPFTTTDILRGLETLDPGRVWRREAINCQLTYLRKRGLVIRIKRAKTGVCAQYVRKGVQPPPDPFRDMRLIEIIRSVLTRPMTPTEIVVAMLEAGYEPTIGRAALRKSVSDCLRDAGFAFVRPRWSRP